MLTNEQLYERHGEDIVFLFKGDEPYVEALGNPMGVLIERDDKVLCFLCEKWYTSLAVHISIKHKISVDEYKELFGFNKGAPLCSRANSKRLSEQLFRVFKENPERKKQAIENLRKSSRIVKYQPKKRMQGLNIRNSCPEQIKQRYRMLQERYGDDVGLNTIRKVDSGVESWGVRHYGSWNKFKEALGLSIDISSKRKEEATLIYDLREYIANHTTLPWNSYTKARKDNFPHSQEPYITRWGTITNALLICGITNRYAPTSSGEIYTGNILETEEYNAEMIKDFKNRINKRAMPRIKYSEGSSSKIKHYSVIPLGV